MYRNNKYSRHILFLTFIFLVFHLFSNIHIATANNSITMKKNYKLIATIIEKYWHHTKPLESFLEVVTHNKQRLSKEEIKKKFTSTLISNVPHVENIMAHYNNNNNNNRFKEYAINFLRLNKRKSLLGHPIASTRANKFSLAAEPGTEFYDPVSATGEPNKGCRKKANKYRMKCLYGGETMDQTTNTRRL